MSGAITKAFDAKLRGQPPKLTHDDVLRLYPTAISTAQVSSDGSTSLSVPSLEQVRFYTSDFAASPDELNARYDKARAKAEEKHGSWHLHQIRWSNKHHKLNRQRNHDFRFTDEEKLRLQQHGFMVTERLGEKSFADVYYKLYTDDMPVYVTSDSVLHAWHRSFDAFLMDLETSELMPLLHTILLTTLAEIGEYFDDATEEMQSVLGEVELYLGVAQHLLVEETTTTTPIDSPSSMRQKVRRPPADAVAVSVTEAPVPLVAASNANRLSQLLELVHSEQESNADILGSPRDVDFSLFKPRGHYTKSADLMKFFRAMTWLGTTDFRVDGAPDDDEEAKATERHQLQCACMLIHLMRKAEVLHLVQMFHSTIGLIAGDGVGADSMTPMQLHELLLEECEVGDLLANFFGPDSKTKLTALQEVIANRGLGAQAISGHPMEADRYSEGPTRPATAFAFLGQQFVWSAFVFSKLVFDEVIDQETNKKVPRRMVSAVDAAFALFGNNVAGVEIAKRMRMAADGGDSAFVPFCDGLPYASNLLTVRQVVDEAMEKASKEPASCSMALLWQLALRELSRPVTHKDQVFTSEAWQKRQMNTQIASFAQLRHDTVLIWTVMRRLAERAVAIISTLTIVDPGEEGGVVETPVQRKGRACFENFATVCGQLAGIAEAQATETPLTDEQTTFLKFVIEDDRGSSVNRYLGWYPSLFYTSREDSGKPDHLVADIHTDAPSNVHGDPGGVLHLGVGDVNLGVFVVDGVMYAGPLFSHYEFVTPIEERLTDDEFSERLGEFEPPKWATQSFLVSKAPLPPVAATKARGKKRLVVMVGDQAEDGQDVEFRSTAV